MKTESVCRFFSIKRGEEKITLTPKEMFDVFYDVKAQLCEQIVDEFIDNLDYVDAEGYGTTIDTILDRRIDIAEELRKHIDDVISDNNFLNDTIDDIICRIRW